MIACRGLTRDFGEFRAVDNVSFAVPAGSVCALLGPNGAGKSTIVKMLTGLLMPTAGDASVFGIDVEGESRSANQSLYLRRICGVLPENLAVFDALTVDEHLALSGAVYGLPRDETRARSEQLLRVLRLDHGRHTLLAQCSYGMRKKTALALALLHNPRALFLDEPFEGIDPVTSQTIRNLLRGVAEKGMAVLLTSHILSLVDQVADRVMMVRQGKLVWNSPLSEVPGKLDELYFDLVEPMETETLNWLGSPQS
jgi:ABC-2 type transport system ATP-binding protein